MTQRRLNSTAASLLGFLHAGPMSGWDLASTAQTVIGDFWSITQSQIYRELSSMAATGLVEPGEPGARERRPYSITPAGREAFTLWLAEEPASETIRFPLLLTVSFGRHLDPHTLQRFIATHRPRHVERLDEYRAQREALAATEQPDHYQLATLEFGIAYEEAVVGWFDRLPDLLGLPDRGRPPTRDE